MLMNRQTVMETDKVSMNMKAESSKQGNEAKERQRENWAGGSTKMTCHDKRYIIWF